MVDKPNDVEAIYHAALEYQSPAERSAYLDAACGADAALRARVVELLKVSEELGDFLESPPAGVTLDNSPRIDGPGTVIGRYTLLELLGEGGMGLVYLAEQKEPVRRKVAFKIIKPGMDSKQVIARFEAERQTLAVLDHPNIAHVFDAGCTETGRPYFVMEHVKGLPITRYCDDNKLTIEQRLRLFEQVCEAVHHAHQKGIIHRDLKPSNILVSVHGDQTVPKIIDFGIAKAITAPLTDKTFATLQGQLLGTPEYMSPEQVDLATQDIDTRSDIYALGVVLYELLAGVLPFESELFERAGLSEIQQTIREQEPASPSMRLTCLGEKAKTIAASRGTQVVPLARRLHRELEWIPLKAMRKDRCRRYRSASEMADDVRNYLNGLPLIAGPETAVYRVQKFVRKHAGSVATVALVAVAIVLGLIVSTAMYFRAESMRVQAEQAREQETLARTRAEQAEEATKSKAEELRRSLYVNSIQLADAKYREGNAGRVRELLASCPNDLRCWEWNRLNYICDESFSSLHTHHDVLVNHRHVVLNPDGKHIVTAGLNDKTIKVWNWAMSEESLTLPRRENMVDALGVSPDGGRIAVAFTDKTIKILDAQNGEERGNLQGHTDSFTTLAFSPNGKQLASGSTYGTVTLWNVQTGARQTVLRGHRSWVDDLAFSPDGNRIVSGSHDRTIRLWNAHTGTELMTLQGHEGWVWSVAFSPDAKYVVSGSRDKTIKVWDAATGKERLTLKGHGQWVFCVTFSPDGKIIASAGRDKTIRIWDAESGNELKTLRGHDCEVVYVAFTPDGKGLISAGSDGTIKLWDVMIDRESAKFHGHSAAVWSLAFSPNSRQIVSCSADSTIRLWDVQGGEAVRTLASRAGVGRSVAFSPDGRRIASCSEERRIVRIWDASTGRQLMTLRGHTGAVERAAFSPDGKRIVSGSDDKTVKVWDATTGAELLTLQGHARAVVSVAFSPDSRQIASGDGDGAAKIWDAMTGAELVTLTGHGREITSIAFSPDGKHIATTSRDRTARIWDAATARELMKLDHADLVFSVGFGPDGKRIVSGCADGMARLWDATTGAEVLALHADDAILDVAFSPDGKMIAAGTGGGDLILWESTPPSAGYEPRKSAGSARQFVKRLYAKSGLYREVMSELQSDTTLDPAVQRLALQIANSRMGEDREKLGKDLDEAWKIVVAPDKDVEAYRAVLEKAGKANALEPNDAAILDVLGGAQLRAGFYEDALKTLEKSERILSDAGQEPDPGNLALKTMTLHKIGRTDEAKTALKQLRELCKKEQFADYEEAQVLLVEVEKLIEGKKP